MGTTGAHTHGDTPSPRGEYAGPAGRTPPSPATPNGHPKDAWIVVGPRTRAHLARVLEQSPLSNAVLVALLEQSGVHEGQGFRLVVDACHLEPETPP